MGDSNRLQELITRHNILLIINHKFHEMAASTTGYHIRPDLWHSENPPISGNFHRIMNYIIFNIWIKRKFTDNLLPDAQRNIIMVIQASLQQKQEVLLEKEKTTITSAEDKVMKVAMQAFGESIMKYLGQTDQVKRVAPTEHIHLEVKQLYEDFNYEMLEGY